jgi:hypothetical protein
MRWFTDDAAFQLRGFYEMTSASPPSTRGEGFLFANRSGRAGSDLGIDRRADKVLEVAEIWSDTLVDVRHFKRGGPTVTLGDRERRSSRWLSGLLTAVLVIGVGGSMIAHARLGAPPLLPEGDLDRIEAWEQARFLATLTKEFDALDEEVAPDVPRLPADLLAGPGWEAFIRHAMVPTSIDLANSGDLPREWNSVLADLPRAYDLLDDLDEPRVVGDLALGTRVILDDTVWTVVPGEFGSLQALIETAPVRLASGSSEAAVEREISSELELDLWAPSTDEVDALETLFHDVQRILFTQADAVSARRARCAAAESLVEFEPDRFDLHAVLARCRADRANWDGAAEAVARATQLDPGEPHEPIAGLTIERYRALQLSVLDADARGSLVAAFDGEALDPDVLEARVVAENAHQTLRSYLVDIVHDPVALRAVGDGIHRLAEQRVQEQQGVHVRRAVVLGGLVLFLLPFGLGLDERRAERRAVDFGVTGGMLPCDPFPLVEHGPTGTTVTLPPDAPGALLRGDDETSSGDLVASGRAVLRDGLHRVALGDDERFVLRLGDTTYLVHHVPAAKAVPGARAASFDGLFLGVLTALLFLGASLGVHLITSDYEVTQEVVEMPGDIVHLWVQPDEKPLQIAAPAPLQEKSNPGDKAREDEGRTGRPDAELARTKGGRVAVQQAEADRRIVDMAGLLPELDMLLANDSLFGGGGDYDELTANLGSHIGTLYGRQRGSGAYSSRGAGTGGGGEAQRLGGVGTHGLPGGRDLERPGEWRRRKPTDVPEREHEGVLFGTYDKSLVDRIVKQNLAQFRFCYERELRVNPKLHGKIVMKWVIDKNGLVSKSNVKRSTMHNALVEQCMVSRVRRLRFPPPRGGGIVLVSYPFVFNAR